ncbi:hypothetical protein [Streptomyces sp. NPDC047043]|uniref:hypothetical protein n=1 Tax=Streptomyces sp. NPDC047043 TaxID=3154497 RepID=UPI00340077BD
MNDAWQSTGKETLDSLVTAPAAWRTNWSRRRGSPDYCAALDGTVTLDQRTALRLAATHAARTSAEVVRTMYDLGGASALYDDSPLQGRFWEASAVTAPARSARPLGRRPVASCSACRRTPIACDRPGRWQGPGGCRALPLPVSVVRRRATRAIG